MNIRNVIAFSPLYSNVSSKEQTDRVLCIIASLEQQSQQDSLAACIVAEALDKKIPLLPVENFRSLAGYGIEGAIDGKHYSLGNAAFMKKIDVLHSEAEEFAERFQEQDRIVLQLAENQMIIGIIIVDINSSYHLNK